MQVVYNIELIVHEYRMSEALEEADAYIELPGKDGRYMQINYP